MHRARFIPLRVAEFVFLNRTERSDRPLDVGPFGGRGTVVVCQPLKAQKRCVSSSLASL